MQMLKKEKKGGHIAEINRFGSLILDYDCNKYGTPCKYYPVGTEVTFITGSEKMVQGCGPLVKNVRRSNIIKPDLDRIITGNSEEKCNRRTNPILDGLGLSQNISPFVEYCETAALFCNKDCIEAENLLKEFYPSSKMLKPDLKDVISIIRKLKTLISVSREGEPMHDFAEKYLPAVQKYQDILMDFAQNRRINNA